MRTNCIVNLVNIQSKRRTLIKKEHFLILIKNNSIYIDKRDTKKLETNLKSLSRFYYAFNESENLREMNKDKIREADKYALVKAPLAPLTPLTLSSLVDMAKDVSDRMIISKAEVYN